MSYLFIKRSRVILGLSAVAFIAIYFITKEYAFLFMGIVTGISVIWLGGILIDMRNAQRVNNGHYDEFGAFVTEELEETYCKN